MHDRPITLTPLAIDGYGRLEPYLQEEVRELVAAIAEHPAGELTREQVIPGAYVCRSRSRLDPRIEIVLVVSGLDDDPPVLKLIQISTVMHDEPQR